MKLDKIDKQIIKKLIENSKLSYKDIAVNLNVSNVTILNRVKKLEEEGYIKNYTVNLDYEKLNYDFQAIIELKTNTDISNIKKIIDIKEVSNIYQTSGDFDVIIFSRFKRKNELNDFISEIKSRDFILDVRSKVILNTIKENNTC